MAKVPFTKLKCKVNIDEIPVQIGEETIAVKQYLPIQDKLALIGRVMEQAHEQDFNYSNPVKANVILDMEIIFAYTNINFTDKQKEDLAKLYDLIYSSGVRDIIFDAIPDEELNILYDGVEDTVESFYKYQNSILGIMDNLKTGYDNTEFDVKQMQKTLSEISNMPLIKEIITDLDLKN